MPISKKVFCFIPAKAASTRLKKKNILPLAGKEMIYYAIHNAQASGLFNEKDIIVSSENEEVQQIARKHGANTPYTREEYLARDPYGIVDVLFDFLDRFPEYKTFDTCCILSVTAPLTEPEDVIRAYSLFEKEKFNALMSVTPTSHSAFRAISVNDKGEIKPIHPEFIRKKSQELPVSYRINGAVILINIAEFLKTKSYFMNPWGAYVMPIERSVDIDNPSDYEYAQFLMEKKN